MNISLLVLFAITALGVYGVALAGWASNSKYSLLGGLRSSAQMISYELALTLSVVGVLLIAGDFSLRDIVEQQARHLATACSSWNIFPQIIGFLCFFIAAIAETNRVPFDLPEAESELVAGFHTEYASMKFAMFFIARIHQHDHGLLPGHDSCFLAAGSLPSPLPGRSRITCRRCS